MDIKWHASFCFEGGEVEAVKDGLNSTLTLGNLGIDGPKWVRKLEACVPRGENGGSNFLRYGEMEELLEDLGKIQTALSEEVSRIQDVMDCKYSLGGLATDPQEAMRVVLRRRSEQWNSCQRGVEVFSRALREASSRR